jgi:hypothetical protein
VALGTALTGCTSQQTTGAETTDTTETTPPATTTGNATTTASSGVETHVGAQSRYSEDVTLTVVLRRDGETVQEVTEGVSAGITTTLGIEITTPGTYTVTASRDGGADATYEWSVPESYDGRLEVRVHEDGGVGFREYVGSDCGGPELPYAVSGNEETFQSGSGAVVNDSGDPATVTVSIAHDGSAFFECTHDLGAQQTLDIGALTATAGEYAVTVEVADGGRTEYDWRIPPGYNWPTLRVVVPESGDPLAGCGTAGSIDTTVSNPAEDQQSVTLALLRGGEVVTEREVSVAGSGETAVALDTPIGDIYTLRATTDSGEATAEVADCYCYTQHRTAVTLDSEGPEIESTQRVCD